MAVGALIAASFLAAAAGGACGGGSACNTAGENVCAAACKCSTDGKCHILKMANGGLSNLAYAKEADCVTSANLVCGNSPHATGFDGAACTTAVATAQCMDDASGRGLLLPSACAAVWESRDPLSSEDQVSGASEWTDPEQNVTWNS